ncbi:Uncharacterised protein [Escherichia coli]|uniref:Uncharacterized protein n=1 Tax=Escherichia coli TaxID=562 RepID=A0AAX2KFQ4_ECOLX|nr:Uncharacterised protein [Escherichia coli]
MIFIIGSSVYEIFRNAICAFFHSPQGIFKQWHTYEKKHYWQPVRYWRSLRLLLSTQLKTTNRSIFPTGGTRALTLSEAITPVSDRRSAMIPTLSTKHSLKKTGSTSMVMRMRRYSSAVTPMQKVSGTTVLRCLWKSNHVSPSTS